MLMFIAGVTVSTVATVTVDLIIYLVSALIETTKACIVQIVQMFLRTAKCAFRPTFQDSPSS